MFMIVVGYLSFVSIDIIDVNLLCLWVNAREIREVHAIFSRDLMKDKLRAEGVSGRDVVDDDDEYTLE